MRNKAKTNVKHVIKNMISKLNENKRAKKVLREELVTAAAGFAALQMKMENPEYKEKHPKLAAFLDILGELGAEASKARTREGVNEQEFTPFDNMSDDEKEDFKKGMDHVDFDDEGNPVSDEGDGNIDDEELNKIEDELESMFDLKCDVPTPKSEPVNESKLPKLKMRNFKRKSPSALLLKEVKNKLQRKK